MESVLGVCEEWAHRDRKADCRALLAAPAAAAMTARDPAPLVAAFEALELGLPVRTRGVSTYMILGRQLFVEEVAQAMTDAHTE
jgi:hypothetical protein